MECATFSILIVYSLFAVSQHPHTNYFLGVRQLMFFRHFIVHNRNVFKKLHDKRSLFCNVHVRIVIVNIGLTMQLFSEAIQP